MFRHGRAESSREAGFTLPELLLSIVIMGVVVGGVGAGIWTVLHNSDASKRQIGGSVDAQVLTSWLLPDVQSAGTSGASVDVAPSTATGCASSPAYNAASNLNVLRLSWTDGSGATVYAAYRAQQATPGDPWKLIRYFCTSGGTASTVTTVRYLESATAATVVNTSTRLGLTVATSVEGTPYSFTVTGTRRGTAPSGVSPATSSPPN